MFLQDNNCVIDSKPCEMGNLYCSLECQLKDAANENLDLANSVAATHYPSKQQDDSIFNQAEEFEEEDDSLFSLDDLSAYYYCTECNDSHLRNHNCTMNTHKSSLPSLSSSNSSITYNLNSNLSQYTSPQLSPENSTNNYTYQQQQQPVLMNQSYTGNGSSPSEWVYNLPVKQAALNKLQKQQNSEEWGLDLNLSSNSSYQLRDGSILNSLIDYTKDFEPNSSDLNSKYSLQNARNNYQLWLENNNMY
ncbi:hypothetical protein BVG19_g5443 [[Candida] boidinii]|nr:hypothetical protein BVG19_g5443 [[Candida] boidinii]OWB53897.1 hypothetical protein B5S27_g5511 [[Candida] boidinii]OWB86845.1 hypothetical protein B5S33_g5564 [[Candida] boidinii]